MLTPPAPVALSAHGEAAPEQAGSVFSWESVSYGVGQGAKSKEILTDNSGFVQGGELCAIVGPSGSGKTSLLNILAARVRSKGAAQRVSGTILLDGQPISGAALRKRIAYVMQQDLLCPTQTPREALLFSAVLRLPSTMPLTEKSALVEKMLADLGLLGCADTFIGNEMIRGISGGEKKRTSIGIELVMEPKLVFLDEPTSGLDSFASFSVVKKLRDLAAHGGCNVLCTIHQPSSEAFHTFQKVLLLSKGTSLFMGTIDALSKHLKAVGLGCPAEYNLADHAIYLIQTEGDESLAKIKGGVDGASAPTAKPKLQEVAVLTKQVTEAKAAGFGRQTFELFKREAGVVTRNKPGMAASIIIPSMLNLLFSLIFLNVGDLDRSDYDPMSHFGAVTMVAIGGMFGSAQPLLLRFPLDRGIFLREYATSTYGAAPYFISKMLVELPQVLMNAMIVYLVTYWLMGFNGNFFYFVFTFWLTGLGAASLALLVGCIAANAEVANQAGPLLFVPQILFAGFYIKTEQIPVWLRWAQYLCSLKYGMNLFILNEFGSDTTSDWPEANKAFAATVIEENDITPDKWWLYVIVLVGIIAGFRVLAIAALARRAAAFF
tara:strand:- start:1252 stop:3063 length:1812 start_codon:yes stop_codon:yes gene_type:complete